MNTFRAFAIFLSLLAILPARAADEQRYVTGKVQDKNAESITIVLDSKKAEAFLVNEQTVILRGRDKISMLDIEVGELAMVLAKQTGGPKTAISVTVKPRP
jgi:hypothetical protein